MIMHNGNENLESNFRMIFVVTYIANNRFSFAIAFYFT